MIKKHQPLQKWHVTTLSGISPIWKSQLGWGSASCLNFFQLFGNSWEFIGTVGLFHLWMTPLVNLIKWNNYPNIKYRSSGNKSESEISEKKKQLRSHLVGALFAPPLFRPFARHLVGKNRLFPYLQWPVFFVFLPNPPKYAPQKLTAFEPENTPKRKRRNVDSNHQYFGVSSR